MMTPEEEMELVLHAIRETASGYLIWERREENRVRRELTPQNITSEAVRFLLQDFVRSGNPIEARKEERPHWMDRRERWYCAIIPIDKLANGLFVEFWLMNDEPDNPIVEIVNAHPER